MKRKVDCLVKVMRLDGTIIESTSHTTGDESESPIYLIEGVAQDQDRHDDPLPAPPPHHQDNYGGSRTVMLGENDANDDGHLLVEMKMCFLTRGAFLLQAVALDAFSPGHHRDYPLGTSDTIHLVIS